MRSVVMKTRLAVLAVAALAAMGLSAGTALADGTAAPAAPAAGAAGAVHAGPLALRRCGTGQLGLSFRGFNAGAGQRFLTLVLMNQSRSTCSVRGYPGIQFYGAFGHALATRESRVAGPRPTVVLRPGNRARSCLRWSAISPPFIHPNVIAVTPPANRSALIAAWRWSQVFHGNISATALNGGNVCP